MRRLVGLVSLVACLFSQLAFSAGLSDEPAPGMRSAVTAFEMKDEMEGTASYHIYLKSENYEEYTNENELRLSCEADGDIWAKFHWGGQHSGGFYNPSMYSFSTDVIHLKFDDEAVKATTYDYLKDKQGMRWFLGKVKAHQRLFIKTGHKGLMELGSVYRFRVGVPRHSGSLAAIAKFEQQCLRGGTSSGVGSRREAPTGIGRGPERAGRRLPQH